MVFHLGVKSTGRNLKLEGHVIARRESRVWRSALISLISAPLVMVFKPFKPPLIRKPETAQPAQEQDASSKVLLQQEDAAPEPKTRPTPSGVRKPLHQVRNVGKESGEKVTPVTEPIKLVGDEKFFNALWYAALNPLLPFIFISGPI